MINNGRIFTKILFLICILCCSGCSNKENSGMRNVFYQSNAHQLYKYDLSSMTVSKIYDGNLNSLSSGYVGVLSDDSFLVTDLFSSRNTRNSPAIYKIKSGNISEKYIADGTILAYFKNENKIFYSSVDRKGITFVYEGMFVDDRIINSTKIIKSHFYLPVVQIDSSHYAFNDPSDDSKVYLYNDKVNKLTYLPIKNCEILFYNQNKKEIFCESNKSVFSVNLNGQAVDEFEGLKNLGVDYVNYFPSDDTIIFSRLESSFFSGEETKYYSFCVKEHKLKRLRFFNKN